MTVDLVNKSSGEVINVKIGFSWTILLFCQFFSIPLFIRRLWGWAVFLLILQLVILGQFLSIEESGALDKMNAAEFGEIFAPYISMYIVYIATNLELAFSGNRKQAVKLLENGWSFRYPDAVETQNARRRWNLDRL